MSYIEDYPLPTAAEEKELLIKAQAGDKKAFDYLVLANSRLVNDIAKKLRDKGIEHEVLFQEGIMGLMKAIDRFDLSKNLRLSTYAYMWIQQYMLKTIQNDSRTIRIPCYMFQRNFSLISASKQLEQELGRSATIEELAEYTNKNIKEIESFTKSMVDVCSINQVCKNGKGETEISEMIADEKIIDIVTEINTSQMIEAIKSVLSEKEFRIFTQKIGLNDRARTCEEIAIDYNLSREKVYGIYRRCLGKLQRNRDIKLYKCS